MRISDWSSDVCSSDLITSVSVRMPVFGLDLSSGARAGLTAFLAGVARSVAHANVTINNILPGYFDTDRYRAGIDATAQAQGKSHDAMHAERVDSVPAGRAGDPEVGRATCRERGWQSGEHSGGAVSSKKQN